MLSTRSRHTISIEYESLVGSEPTPGPNRLYLDARYREAKLEYVLRSHGCIRSQMLGCADTSEFRGAAGRKLSLTRLAGRIRQTMLARQRAESNRPARSRGNSGEVITTCALLSSVEGTLTGGDSDRLSVDTAECMEYASRAQVHRRCRLSSCRFRTDRSAPEARIHKRVRTQPCSPLE
jgi:hypothetical protein